MNHPLHIVMIGVAAHGHMNPQLPVVAELVARGHRVEVTTPPPFAAAVAATGASVVEVGSVLPDEERGETWSDDPVAGMARFLAEGRHVLPQAVSAFDADRPDVLIGDIGAYAARVLAHRWDRPLVQLSPTYVAWEGYERDMAEVLDGLRAMPGYPAYQEDFAAWLAAEDVPLDLDTFTGRPPRSAVLVPRALQPNADEVDAARYTFVGPALDTRAHQDEWPTPERPVVLVSLGSAYSAPPSFYRACLDAFADLDRDVVVKTGPLVDPDDLGPVPRNASVHRWVPQLALLEHASAFVTHAGMGGCSEGLWHGVPMVAVPQAVDQFGNADRLVELGVARRLDVDATAETLRATVTALESDEDVAARSAALRAELRASGGAAGAADLIEEAAARRS
ncbi:macrolide family glycosyltransferase [Pseudonocardia nematodicida]|uniref:Macrolide family glycosyltransferase n=1 Tax=Pseudonocardia nematodicida TaxID=1206997 RepID=A0ABV1K6V6_9PSEU